MYFDNFCGIDRRGKRSGKAVRTGVWNDSTGGRTWAVENCS